MITKRSKPFNYLILGHITKFFLLREAYFVRDVNSTLCMRSLGVVHTVGAEAGISNSLIPTDNWMIFFPSNQLTPMSDQESDSPIYIITTPSRQVMGIKKVIN